MKPLVIIIRNAYLNNKHRKDIILELERVLGVSKFTAKRLAFAWVYRAEEELLQDLLKSEV